MTGSMPDARRGVFDGPPTYPSWQEGFALCRRSFVSGLRGWPVRGSRSGSTSIDFHSALGDKRYADALRGYLRSETIAPLPLQRLAAAHPDTVDAVFRKVLRRRDFTWAEHGEALMRRRKAWYYQHEPRPGVSVIGARLLELASGGRR